MPRHWTHAQDSAHVPCCPTGLTSMVPSSRPTGGVAVKVTDKTELCIACPRGKALFLLSKLFISSSRNRQFPPLCKRNTGLVTGRFELHCETSFYPCVSSTCLCPLRPCRLSCFLVWHFCQAVSRRTGQRIHHPTPSTSWLLGLLPWILKPTGCVLWLSNLRTREIERKGGQQISQLCDQSGLPGRIFDLL